jgi:hypothetical protein
MLHFSSVERAIDEDEEVIAGVGLSMSEVSFEVVAFAEIDASLAREASSPSVHSNSQPPCW